MDFDRTWSTFALEAEHDRFGMSRIALAHNQLAHHAEKDAKDAARYRFLATSDYVDVYAESSSKEDLDRRIDAIMASDAIAQAELAREAGQ